MGDVGRCCREPIRSNQRIQGSAAVAAYGCLYPRRSRRKVRRHSVETVAVAVRVGSHIEVRRCGVSICGALVVRPVHGPHILSRSASQAVERLAEIATKVVNLSQSMHVAPEVLTSDVSRRARRRIRLVAVRASEHAKPPGSCRWSATADGRLRVPPPSISSPYCRPPAICGEPACSGRTPRGRA